MAESTEAVALRLLSYVAASERVNLGNDYTHSEHPSREWILDTFAECLKAARGLR